MGRQSSIVIRELQILKHLEGRELNSQEIASDLGIPYPTVRRIITNLLNTHRIEASGYKGGTVYTAVNTDSMPSLTNFGNTQPLTFYAQQMADRALANNGQFTSDRVDKAMQALAMGITGLLKQAYNIIEHGFVDEAEIKKIRKSLGDSERTFLGMTSFVRQLLDDPVIWTTEGMVRMQYSKHYDTDLINKSYNNLWAKKPTPVGNE